MQRNPLSLSIYLENAAGFGSQNTHMMSWCLTLCGAHALLVRAGLGAAAAAAGGPKESSLGAISPQPQ